MLGELRRSLRSPEESGWRRLAGEARRDWVVNSGQASAPRRTAVTFGPNFDEADLIGGRK